MNSCFLNDQCGGIKWSQIFLGDAGKFHLGTSEIKFTSKMNPMCVHIKNNHSLKGHMKKYDRANDFHWTANPETFIMAVLSLILLRLVVNTCLVTNKTQFYYLFFRKLDFFTANYMVSKTFKFNSRFFVQTGICASTNNLYNFSDHNHLKNFHVEMTCRGQSMLQMVLKITSR
jgi:hypothetical protein